MPTGLRLRGHTYVYEVRHPRLRGGRMVLSLRTEDALVAAERLGVIRALMDRGDWAVIDRLRKGDLHITDAVRSVRQGDVAKLRRTGHDLLLLRDAVEAFMRRTEATLARNTQRQYQLVCDMLIERFGADFAMPDLTVEQAEAWLHEGKPDRPWSVRRQHLSRTVAGALWQNAIEADERRSHEAGHAAALTRNPWRDVRLPKIRQTRVVFLSPREWADLYRAVEGRPQAAALGLAFLAGLRATEITHLRTDVDVLLDAESPIVRIQSRGGEHPWRPKTQRSERDVPIGKELLRILRDHVNAGYAGSRYFIRLAGKDEPVSYSTLSDRWTRHSFEAAGIKYGREGDGLTLHSGRHTYASWLAQRGVPLNIVAELLGDTMKVVYDTYAHLVPSTLRQAVEVIDRAVQEGDARSTDAPTGETERG